MKAQRIWLCGPLFEATGIGCCDSCAGDAAEGYPICEIESPRHGRPWDSGRWVSEVCCAHASMCPEEPAARRLWWAILLRAQRRKAPSSTSNHSQEGRE